MNLKQFKNLSIILLSLTPALSYAEEPVAESGAATEASESGGAATEQQDSKDADSRVQNKINSDYNYLGDRVIFPTRVYGKYKDVELEEGKPKETDTPVCIPAETPLRGMGKIEDSKLDVRLKDSKDDFWRPKEYTNCYGSDKKIPSDVVITVDINKNLPDRYGFTYGALVVPYKYQLGGSHDIKSGSSIGPYLGWEMDRGSSLGLGLKGVVFVGGSMHEVTRVEDGEEETETIAGISYGLGIIGEVKREFQFGVIVGSDETGEDSGYEDDNKWWVALAIGYSFTD